MYIHVYTITNNLLRYTLVGERGPKTGPSVFSVISFVLKEIILTTSISDSTVAPVSMESEAVRVVSPCRTKISVIIRLKIRTSTSKYLKAFAGFKLNVSQMEVIIFERKEKIVGIGENAA